MYFLMFGETSSAVDVTFRGHERDYRPERRMLNFQNACISRPFYFYNPILCVA